MSAGVSRWARVSRQRQSLSCCPLLPAAVPAFPTGAGRPMPPSRRCVPPRGLNRCIQTMSTASTGRLVRGRRRGGPRHRAPALADIGRQFVEQVDRADFTDHLLSLAIGFPLSGPGSDWNNRSGASCNLTDDCGARLEDVTADQVGADLRFWIEVVNFPGVASVELHRPAQQGSRDGRSRVVYARVVDGNAGNVLQTRYPELRGHWQT